MSTTELEKLIAQRRRIDDEALLRTLAECVGQGLKDLTSTRKTPVLIACRRVMVQTLRWEHGWTVARVARALGWPVKRVKRMSATK